jgi:F-type H+-transporting ATPase subunit delta
MENFLHLIVRKKAGGLVERISEIYSGLADELFNRLNLTVESAVPMGREEQERLEKILRAGWNKTILVDYRIRPDLIAGLVLKAGERVYDLSLRGQLIRMKGRLLS